MAGDEPKIVQVVGKLDANTADDGRPIACPDYNVAPYTLENYLQTYDPAHWTGPATGPVEDARKASSAKQAERVRLDIGANTTLIGLSDAHLVGFVVNIESVDNVIVRNLRISDAYDCFPGWNGETWKTEWDNVVVSRSTHVWLDHLTLDDGDTVDTEQPKYFGEPFLRHDGLLDVVRQADLVTISWNKLKGHDKSLLWGNGDGVVADRGKIRVTMHHNELTDLVQRAPRVRFGQAHVYNNLYRVTNPDRYEYSWGVGVESSIIARSNWFQLEGVTPDRIIYDWGGTGITESGNWVNGRPTDVLKAYNAVHPDDQLLPTVAGSSGPHLRISPAPSVPALVGAWAGAGRLDQNKQLLQLMNAPATTTADGPVWSQKATGMASIPTAELPDGTTGGLGGRIVVAGTAEELTRYAGSAEPLVIVVRGSLRIPFGTQVPVASNKTIIGAGTVAELVGGGLFLNGTHNVIVRNLRIRDSYIPGDWDGKSADNDNDGIRLDTAHHVWIDHVTFERLGDGLVDVRKDSDYVTLSWNVFSAHNKTVGVGWTANVITKITMHHNWFSNTYQRNASIDNVEAAHVYNNWFRGFGQYGTMSRGAAKVVAESNYYSDGEDPIVAKDPASQIVNKNNVFNSIRGRRDNVGTAFDPATYYSSTPDTASKVPGLVGEYAGPTTRDRTYGRTVTVALDGTGDFGSIGAAVATVGGRPATIIVKPGVYREVVRIWAFQDNLTIRGATGNPADVVLTYDLAAGQEKFYGGTFGHTGSATLGILGDDVTVENITVENGWDEQANFPSQAIALRTAGDRIRLDNVRVLGNQDTLLLDTPNREAIVRTWITDSLIQGDVDFIYGRGTAVITDSTIKSVNRGQPVNGYVTAAATVDTNPHGYLIERSRFESDAAAGTVFLGRPWHPSGDPGADPRVVVRDSWLGAHIGTPAWTDMSGWSWRDARFAEYHNTGPGAATGDGRPQLTDTEAAAANRSAWLAGSDGWNPVDRD